MIYLLIFLLFALSRLDRIRRARRETVVLRHRYRLYALRDRLREAALCEKADPANWVFLYIDSSITKAINALDELTVGKAALSIAFYRPADEHRRRVRRLVQELRKPSNAALRSIYREYSEALMEFLRDRHVTMRVNPHLRRTNDAVAHARAKIAEQVRTFLTQGPDTSTFSEYAEARSRP